VPLPRYDFEDGDFWGNQIFNDLEIGAAAWIYWNMILDEQGGPWSISYIHGNPDPNAQHPVVIVDRHRKKVTYTGLYYYLTHFSKFVRPGAVRVQTTGLYDGVRVISFRSADGHMVSQLMNSRNWEVDANLISRGRRLAIKLPAISITTALWSPTPPGATVR
jgi:glucosylceramidase